MLRAIPRLVLSGAFSALLLSVCIQLPHINDTTAALLMVLCILGLAIKRGWAEALTAAIVGGLGFDYYFLGPPGFSITSADYGVALGAFLITAIATGRLAVSLKRRRIEAERRQSEMEKLYKLANAVLSGGGRDFSLTQVADELAEIFGAGGVALYDRHTGWIVRSGSSGGVISDQALYETASCGRQLEDTGLAFSLTPIRHGGEMVGSLGLSGGEISQSLVNMIGMQVGMGLAKLYSMERTVEAEAARRSEELKSAVMDAMAHEIRNPLNSIKIAATTLLSADPGSELFKREMLTIIDEEVNRMDRFLDETVQMAREKASELSPKKAPQHIEKLIPAAVEEMSALAGRRPIHVSVPESLPPAECDKEMIARVLKQLMGNALKYSPEGSPLTVSAEFTGAAIVIDVADRGPGVDYAERDRIFEKYYRGRAARDGAPGTGLGLASARSIVEAHGGQIWVTSPPAGGAAFHVSLPATNGPPPAGGTNWALRKS